MTQSGPTDEYDWQDTARNTITSEAARNGWTVRGAGVYTVDYLLPRAKAFIRVRYDSAGRIRRVVVEVGGVTQELIKHQAPQKRGRAVEWIRNLSL